LATDANLWHRKETTGHTSPSSGGPDRQSANVLKPASFGGDSLRCASSVNVVAVQSTWDEDVSETPSDLVTLEEIKEELPKSMTLADWPLGGESYS